MRQRDEWLARAPERELTAAERALLAADLLARLGDSPPAS
jgi:hypothetical protein